MKDQSTKAALKCIADLLEDVIPLLDAGVFEKDELDERLQVLLKFLDEDEEL